MLIVWSGGGGSAGECLGSIVALVIGTLGCGCGRWKTGETLYSVA